MKASPTRLFLFDFDGTLTTGDTFLPFIAFSRGRLHLALALIRSLPWIFLWKMRCVSNSKAKQALFSAAFKGYPYTEFVKKGNEFADYVRRHERKEMISILDSLSDNKNECIIISASMEEWIAPWAREHGIVRVISTIPEVDKNGILTGHFATPNCHGVQKTERLLAAIPDLRKNRKDYDITAYGDSDGDTALLRFADHPHKI